MKIRVYRVVMAYTKHSSFKLGTASKTITLDLSVWAAWAEICNRKKWTFTKALTNIGYQENDIQKQCEKQREITDALNAIQTSKKPESFIVQK